MDENSIYLVGFGPEEVKLIQLIIRHAGYAFDFHQAEASVNGLDLAKQADPSLVFLDYDSVTNSILEILRWIKTNKEVRSIPLIVITRRLSRALPDSIHVIAPDLYLSWRPVAVLGKPFSPQELIDAVQQALKKHF